MATRSAHCRDCGAKSARGMCPDCKLERRRLWALHARWRRHEPGADREHREGRVREYAAAVAAGRPVFG